MDKRKELYKNDSIKPNATFKELTLYAYAKIGKKYQRPEEIVRWLMVNFKYFENSREKLFVKIILKLEFIK